MDSIGGIPIVSMEEVVRPVFDRFDRTPGDEGIKHDILRVLRQAIESDDLHAMRRFLAEDPALWIGTLQSAYFFKDREPLSNYTEWAEMKCDLLVQIAGRTRDDDGIIQHILNYEDFHVEVMPFPFGPVFVVEMYRLRGLDFFLFHYMGGQTDAHSDDALFEHASCVPTALKALGREEEAKTVFAQLGARRRRLASIGRDFTPPGADSTTPTLEMLRVLGERFWFDYLSGTVWRALARQSRHELLDAFSTEYLLQAEILTTWSTVALILCRVIERETADTLFGRWTRHFSESEFRPPAHMTKKEQRRVEARRMTYDVAKKAACETGPVPTLGQLVFLASFWRDDVMDRCTQVFQDIRSEAEHIDDTHSDKVGRLATLLKGPLAEEAPKEATLVRLRNAAAHPRSDPTEDWQQFIVWLKQALGEPPRRILHLVAVEARLPMPSIEPTSPEAG